MSVCFPHRGSELLDHGAAVSVLDELGRQMTSGKIVGITRMNPARYDVLTPDCGRLNGIPASRVAALA